MNSIHLPKIAVIAGVGPGLGAALARRFAREGCRVALLARSAKYVETLAAEMNAAHKSDIALPVQCDLTSPNQIENAFAQAREKWGPIDLLVNHASGGAGPRGSGLLNLELANFEHAWRVGVYAALRCSREAARDMLSPGVGDPGGTILFTGATSSVRGAGIAFSSAKFASRGLAQALARELWPQGIHVAHVVIDGIIGETADAGPESNDEGEGEALMHPDAIAEAYWQLIRQERSAWTLELDLRPHREKFFE
jgi:NAD(P)-dependent dehydrogenase (short-subunit alcohol dehydrogenase family)